MGKGTAYIFIETVSSILLGYIFWLTLTKIASPEDIGTSSTVVSIATIFITVASIGIPSGVQRFLGKFFSEKKIADSRVYVKASLVWTVIGVAPICASIFIARDWFNQTFGIGFELLLVFIVLIATSAVSTLFRSIVISSFDTRRLPLIAIVSSIVKIVLAIFLVLQGLGTLGIISGYAIYPISASVLLIIVTIFIFKKTMDKPEVSLNSALRNIFTSSTVTWIPSLVYTIGVHLGTVVVFGARGAQEAGIYFIAFSIAAAIGAAMSVIFTMAYPTLSGMTDGRKRLTWRITKITLVISLPLCYSLIFYSKDIMGLFGNSYAGGSLVFTILLISQFPSILSNGINTLSYSYGNYRQVLAIGLASNIPRTVLYFIFVPMYGGLGAAIVYTIGSISGLIISLICAKKLGMHIFWKDLILLLLIPSSVAFVQSYFNIHYVLAILITLFISYILFLKLQIITRMDLQDSFGILPPHIANPLLKMLNALGKKLNSSY